jgi:hypothetical protein
MNLSFLCSAKSLLKRNGQNELTEMKKKNKKTKKNQGGIENLPTENPNPEYLREQQETIIQSHPLAPRDYGPPRKLNQARAL